MRAKSLYMTSKEIKETFHCGDSTFTNIRKILRDHPERYTPYAVVKRLTSALAFADASKFKDQIEAGESIPDFDPDEVYAVMYGRFNND